MESLKTNRDFKIVYSRGKSRATSNLVLYWLPNHRDYNRFGFSISKKIGIAVIRNKIKRRLKEIVKKQNLPDGYDFIFIARKPVVNVDFHRLQKDVEFLFGKLKIR